MKILFFTDIHLRSYSDRPKWRVDDHYVSQFEELDEIKELVKVHNVDLLVSGGDTLHHPDVSHALVSDIMTWCKTLSCDFYSIVGNHCCFGYRTDDLKSSGLGVLFESGYVTRLDERVFDKEKVIIRGIHANLDPRQGDYWFDEKYSEYKKYIFSHNFVIPQDVIFDAVKPHDIKTNANVIFLGHYHQEFDHIEGYTRFINPGSISRWSINEQHKPKVLLLDTATNVITPFELKSSHPANEIFDMVSAAEIKATEMNLQSFVDSLEGASFENIDVEQVLVVEGKKQQIDQNIVYIALDKVRQAKRELK